MDDSEEEMVKFFLSIFKWNGEKKKFFTPNQASFQWTISDNFIPFVMSSLTPHLSINGERKKRKKITVVGLVVMIYVE
jgi:hypothetical protein